MITRFGLVQKREDMTLEQFNTHWQEKHGPIVAGMDNIRHYRQNLVTNATQLGIGFATRSPITVDGFSELCWDNAHEQRHRFPGGSRTGGPQAVHQTVPGSCHFEAQGHSLP